MTMAADGEDEQPVRQKADDVIAADGDWVAQMHCLTVHPEHQAMDQLGESQRRIAVLWHAAQAVVADDNPETRAAFNAVARGAEARVLAEELAGALPEGEHDRWANCSHTGRELVMVYLQALHQASTAVYFCRRIQHPAGSCWFSVRGPQEDLCGRVLSITHRLGDAHQPAAPAVNSRRRR